MNNLEYWQDREEEALKHYLTDEKEFEKELHKIYQNTLDNVQKEIDSFYSRYADAEGITINTAKRRVSKLDIEAYERKAEKYVKNKTFTKKANQEMRLYNATMRINRLEMLKANIGLELIAGTDELDKFMQGVLQGRTEEELKRQAGILGKTVKNNAETAKVIVNSSFHNAKFSDRIWTNQALLRADLDKALQTGLIQGKNPRVLARDFKKKFETTTYNAERLLRTELARVQTEAQKKSFEKNGFEEYTFIANGGCCDDCQALHGKHFKVAKMMPGENAAPLHPHCRCSTAAYEDSKEYEAWLDFLANGGTTKEWEALNDAEYLRNNLPKAFKDPRNVGKPISKKEFEEFVSYAEEKGVRIGHNSKPTGGFETYCGDTLILKEIIDELAVQQNSKLYKMCKIDKPILIYDNVLGYEKDNSKIDIGAFALTKGKTITLNKFMFDDSDFLKSEYIEAERRGFFVKGSDYTNIITHETGHIIDKNIKGLRTRVVRTLERQAIIDNVEFDEFISVNISVYAADLNDKGEYHEIVSEVNSLLKIDSESVIIQALKKEGVI